MSIQSVKLESFVRRCTRDCSSETPTYSNLTDTLFSRIMTHQRHVLQPLLPDRHPITYSLRQRTHNKDTIEQKHATQSR